LDVDLTSPQLGTHQLVRRRGLVDCVRRDRKYPINDRHSWRDDRSDGAREV